MDEHLVEGDDSHVRSILARLLRHSIEHRPGVLDARTAMVALKNGLFEAGLKNPIPVYVVEVVADPSHEARVENGIGPYVAYSAQDAGGLVPVTALLLNPELRFRCAAIAELERQLGHVDGKHDLLVTPSVQERVNELRDVVASNDVRSSLSAAIEINDLLESDFF